jgi:hypothetical protein
MEQLNNNSKWTLVQYKNKKNKLKKNNTNRKQTNKNKSNNNQSNNKQSNNKQSNDVFNSEDYIKLIRQKYSDDCLRPIKKKDYTLSDEEEIIISKYQSELCCYCCSSSYIENIIKRPFTSCGVCYCCVGDDPSFDIPELCIFVNDKLDKHVVFWDKKPPYKYYNN